jgi:hypothetical protein
VAVGTSFAAIAVPAILQGVERVDGEGEAPDAGTIGTGARTAEIVVVGPPPTARAAPSSRCQA